jgi:hypothetical protein
VSSEFDSFFALFAMPSLLTTHGENITIIRTTKSAYDPATGTAGTSSKNEIPASGIVEDVQAQESDADGLRIAEYYKVTTTTQVFDGDSVVLRNFTYRVKNIISPNQGVYEFEARR